jgi:hypothetical protein
MTEDTIREDVIDKVNDELAANEDAKLHSEVDKVKSEYQAELDALKSKFDTFQSEQLKKEELTAEEKRQAEFDALKKANDDMKADFEKRLDAISLRKSVPTNDAPAAGEEQKPYSELSEKEQNEADAAWFKANGYT